VVDLVTGEECEPAGTPTCDAQCHFVHTCGNGVIEPGEECDGQPGCSFDCKIQREICCEFSGVACVSGAATTGLDEYEDGKTCFLAGGTGSYGVCNGTAPCPEPLSDACKLGRCSDVAITPSELCCQHPDGTCTGSTVVTAASVGNFGCTPSPFDFPQQGDIDHLVLGRCGDDGRCLPAQN